MAWPLTSHSVWDEGHFLAAISHHSGNPENSTKIFDVNLPTGYLSDGEQPLSSLSCPNCMDSFGGFPNWVDNYLYGQVYFVGRSCINMQLCLITCYYYACQLTNSFRLWSRNTDLKKNGAFNDSLLDFVWLDISWQYFMFCFCFLSTAILFLLCCTDVPDYSHFRKRSRMPHWPASPFKSLLPVI